MITGTPRVAAVTETVHRYGNIVNASPVADALPFLSTFVQTELNGVNDNPVVDPDTDAVLHGGNFYGGHVAFAMDSLKAAVASIADLLDRQLELMGNPTSNNGLPGNLVAPTAPGGVANHGFKAMQIATSALAAEALKNTMPAASFSRSTESHNQDKVSMGTIAARDCLRVLQLSEQVAAPCLLAACQGVELRQRCGDSEHRIDGGLKTTLEEVRSEYPPLEEDRAMEPELRHLVERIQERKLHLYQGGLL